MRAPATPAGYSGTALAKKLGIKAGQRVLLVNAPDGYRKLLESLLPQVELVTRADRTADMVHIFVMRRVDLAKALAAYRKQLPAATPVWVSWPKCAAKLATDVTEDVIRELALPLGFVDIKVRISHRDRERKRGELQRVQRRDRISVRCYCRCTESRCWS
jgi:hypothetical protein